MRPISISEYKIMIIKKCLDLFLPLHFALNLGFLFHLDFGWCFVMLSYFYGYVAIVYRIVTNRNSQKSTYFYFKYVSTTTWLQRA